MQQNISIDILCQSTNFFQELPNQKLSDFYKNQTNRKVQIGKKIQSAELSKFSLDAKFREKKISSQTQLNAMHKGMLDQKIY